MATKQIETITRERHNIPLLLLPDPEPWPEPVDGKALLDELAATFKRFVVLPSCAEETLALWTLHTYAFQLRSITAYLALESPEKRCGKTTLLGVLSRLVFRPVVAANISPSAFFRVIQETQPTLVIDEADTFVRGNEQLRGILNAGYYRTTAYVVRVGNQKPGDMEAPLRTYSCWCPKVMATIGRLPETLADRCIVIPMQRKQTVETREPLGDLDASVLRQRCARFVADHPDAIAGARPDLPVEMNDRAGGIWAPLLALADLAGGDWPEKARRAAVYLSERAQEASPVAGLFVGIVSVFAIRKVEKISSRALVEGLNGLSHAVWRPLTKGKDLTERWLAQLLRPYGIAPKHIHVDDRQVRGYADKDFYEPFRRYVSHSQAMAVIDELAIRAEAPSAPAAFAAPLASATPPAAAAPLAPVTAPGKNAELERLERELARLERLGSVLRRGGHKAGNGQEKWMEEPEEGNGE